MHQGVLTCYMVAVVGEVFTRGQTGRFSNNPVALNDLSSSVRVLDYPLACQEGYGPIRVIMDGEIIDEGVRAVWRQFGATVLIDQFV